jgi:hypothetical protein
MILNLKVTKILKLLQVIIHHMTNHLRHYEEKCVTMITIIEHILESMMTSFFFGWNSTTMHWQRIENFKTQSTHQHDAIDDKLRSLQNIIKRVFMFYISQMTCFLVLYINNIVQLSIALIFISKSNH